MQDVADAAGVSRAAVSLVLNNRVIRIGDEKRRAILAAAKRLNYRPNLSALRLRRQRTETLRLVFTGNPDDLNEIYMLELIRNIAVEARRNGYDLLLDLTDPGRDPLGKSAPGRADGSIFLFDQNTPSDLVKAIGQSGEPFVALGGSRLKHPPGFLVDFDVAGGMRQITRHLIDLGHREIAFLVGVESPAKAAGYRAAMSAAGLRPRPAILCGLRESGIADAVRRLLDNHPRPTALMATNDTLAIRTIKALLTMDLAVPQDLSVTGFDDMQTASLIMPPLTTAHIPLDEMATEAIGLLLSQIENPAAAPRHIVLPTPLVVRDSAIRAQS